MEKVVFYNGNTKLGEDNSAPYSISWNNVSPGNYILEIRSGNYAEMHKLVVF